MLTGHGDGSGSGLPPLRPLVQSDVPCPAPFSQRNEVVLSTPPIRAGTPAPIGQRETRGAVGLAAAWVDEGRRFAGVGAGWGGPSREKSWVRRGRK